MDWRFKIREAPADVWNSWNSVATACCIGLMNNKTTMSQLKVHTPPLRIKDERGVAM